MNESEKQKTIGELKDFYKKLKSYKRLVHSENITESQKRYMESLREKLIRKSAVLKDGIEQLTGKRYYTQFGQDREIWSSALSSNPLLTAINFCIDATNEAIAKLEATPKQELQVHEKQKTLNETPEKTPLPDYIFDKMQFHPKVIESSRSCFGAGNYREAILNAFISLIDYVKEITGLDLDGDDLMNQVFSFNYDKDLGKITKYPIIRLNELKNSSDRGEQQGFMFLYKGAAGAIRNPKAHKVIPQSNPLHTLEYLAFASLLMRTVEESAAPKTKLTKINEEIFLARCREGAHERAVDLYQKAKALKESRYANGDFINWGVSGYSYRMPWKGYRTGETLFVAYGDGKLQIWPEFLRRRKSIEAGQKYLEKLRSIPSLAREFSTASKHKFPTVSTDEMKTADIEAFISAVKELGLGLDEISKV